MPIREGSYSNWSSDRSFLWLSAGAVMGVGNVMRLPFLAGEYGGSAFLMVYVLALLVVGWPLLVAEMALGRWARHDPVSSIQLLTQSAPAHRYWSVLGWLSCLGAVVILSYFSVVAGWSLAYAIRGAGGVLAGISAEGAADIFYALARDPERSLAWHTIFIAIVCIVVAHGHRDGSERASSYLFPGAFGLGLLVMLFGVYYGDASAALRYIFTPDWSRLGWHGALEAIHQAFFTLAVGGGVMLALGSYLPARSPLHSLALGVIALDTIFSLMVGVGLYALVFASARDAAPGLTLLFQVLPQALPPGLPGVLGAALVYTMLFAITLNAAMALMEPVIRIAMDRQRITRVFASVFWAIIIWYLGIGTLLSFNVTEHMELWGRNFFDWMQWLSGRLLLPAAGLLLCIFAARILPEPLLRETWGESPAWAYRVWTLLLRYPTRIAMIVLLIYCLGIIDFLVALWTT